MGSLHLGPTSIEEVSGLGDFGVWRFGGIVHLNMEGIKMVGLVSFAFRVHCSRGVGFRCSMVGDLGFTVDGNSCPEF